MSFTAHPVDLTIGELYRFRGIKGHGGRWSIRPGTYRLIGTAKAYRTGQEQVMYIGEGGWDHGNPYVCCLSDWVRDFTRIVEEIPEKAAGQIIEGSGV